MEPPPPSYDYAISGELLPYPTDAGGLAQKGQQRPSAPPPEIKGQGASDGVSLTSGDPEETKSREDQINIYINISHPSDQRVAPPDSNPSNAVTRDEGTSNPSMDNHNGTSPTRGNRTSKISPVDNNDSLIPDASERANFQNLFNEASTLLKAEKNKPTYDSSRPSIIARQDRSSKIALSFCLCFSVIMLATAIGAGVYFSVNPPEEYPKISPRPNSANQLNPKNCREDPPYLAKGSYQSVANSAPCHTSVSPPQYSEGTKCNFVCDFRDQYNLPRQNIQFTCIEAQWVSTYGELECVDFDEEVEDLRSGGEGPY